MGKSCCVIRCTSKYKKGNGLHFYRIPKEPDDRRKLWIAAIKPVGPNGQQCQWEPKDDHRVCSRHFIKGTKSNDPDNPDYVPSINMENSCENRPQQEMDNIPTGDNDEEIGKIKLESKAIKKTLNSQLSIFKLAKKRLAGLKKNRDDVKKFGQHIKEKLIERGMQHLGDNDDKCQPYHLMHFYYITKKKVNVTTKQIKEQLAYPEGIEDCRGDRRSGNILVFYRLKENVPEAFFLCQGLAYHFILHLSDPSFRTRVVKRFMDGEKIKEIGTLNIAGSDIASTITYRDNCNIAAVSLLERAIVNLSGIIVRDSELDQLIQRAGEKKDILMEIGINFVRICKPLSLEKWTKVLELFSDEVDDEETEVDRPTCHIRDALEYVRRVEEDMTCRTLNETITEKAIDIIANNQPTSSYYLSHRYIRDWSLSSHVILSEKTSQRKSSEITSWSSAPTFSMVIKAINENFTTDSLIKQSLGDHKIVLSYDKERSGMKQHPVQDFVHGSVSQDGGQYFKIAQKWFFFSSTYSQVVDRNFAYMYQCMLVDKRISDLMKYPWRTQKLGITTSDCKTFLRVSHNVGKQILKKLTNKCTLVDTSNHCCLTDNSYLLPQSSKLYRELAKNHQIGRILHQILTSNREINDIGVRSVLQEKKGEICVQDGRKYVVCNPILTATMMEQIKLIDSSLEEPILSIFLRCMSPLSEGDYNALYLNSEENDNFIIFPGYKVLANNVELFDILVYDKENHTTYLFHNKVGLDHHTRDACAQIRNASELLWHDFMRGQRNHIELFWESAVNSTTAETPYRYFLKRRLEKLGKNTFMDMFDNDAKIVFVLGFVISESNASPKFQWLFKPLTLKDFQENDLNEHDKTWLEEKGILTESGYVTDYFIGMTQDKFVEQFKSNDAKKRRKKIYTWLRTTATCNLSTIAKLELLTLNNCFLRYQTGTTRHYHLKLLQLDSK